MWALTNDGVTSTPVLVAGDVGGVGGTDGDDTIVGMTTTLSQDADWSKKSRGKKMSLNQETEKFMGNKPAVQWEKGNTLFLYRNVI